MRTLERFVDHVGDWNPQLLRELRGKLTLRNVIITALLSIGCQWLLYSISFQELESIVSLILIIVGSYLLSYDLAQEYRQRTLEFIRLTPQSSEAILTGKILGVPILLYLGVFFTIPLFLIRFLQQGFPILMMIGWAIFWVVKVNLFYNFSLFYTITILKNPHRNSYPPVTIAGSVALIILLFSGMGLGYSAYEIEWYGFSLKHPSILFWLWLIITFATINYFFWKILNRQFQNFEATLITKKQSYQMTLMMNIWLLGFVVNSPAIADFSKVWLFGVVPCLSLVFMALLFPCHPYLLEWARDKNWEDKRFWQDFIWGEKSPPIIAVLINGLIPTLIWSVCLLLVVPEDSLKILLCSLALINIILICGMIPQILMLHSHRDARVLAIIVTSILLILPTFISIGLMAYHSTVGVLWLFTPFPIVAFYNSSLLTFLVGLSLQLVILGILTAKLQKQIQLLGASETQTLLRGHP